MVTTLTIIEGSLQVIQRSYYRKIIFPMMDECILIIEDKELIGGRLYIIIHVCIHITYVLLRVWVCCIHEKSSTIMLLLVSTITPYSHLSSPQSSNETHSYPKYIFILWFLTKELPLFFFLWIKEVNQRLLDSINYDWILKLNIATDIFI